MADNKNNYSELLTNSDVVAFLMKHLKGLQEQITDLNVKECVIAFVEKSGFDRKKTIKENIAECISFMAFKRHYDDRHSNKNA